MATITLNYSTNTALSMDLAALASSSTFLAGRECAQVDNTAIGAKFVDALVSGAISVGTTPTANTQINVYVWGSDTTLASKAIDTLGGINQNVTLTNSGILANLRLGASLPVIATTSDIAYQVQPFSVAALFGGVLPKFWGLFVAHNTGVNLRNTSVNTNSLSYVGVKYDSA